VTDTEQSGITWIIGQRFGEYKVEEKLLVLVREQRRLNATDLAHRRARRLHIVATETDSTTLKHVMMAISVETCSVL
jgi:hypothetical protein